MSNRIASGFESHQAVSNHMLEQPVRQDGVSVVICCHNSSCRLPAALTHLAAQQVPDDLPWEVIVIDNASSDDTAVIARSTWPVHAPVPLRVVHEPKLGLIHARHRGFVEAKYEFVSFIDDDNWVAPDWVEVVFDIMCHHPEVGACGGYSEPVCEADPPSWFSAYSSAFAVGCQGATPGDISDSRGYLWGAGLTIRRSAWCQLRDNGFGSLLLGRRGNELSAGEDSELCFALRLAGWRLWYEPKLQLRHYLPANRLKWMYLRRLYRGFGASTAGHDPYRLALADPGRVPSVSLSRTWWCQALLSSARIMLQTAKLLVKLRRKRGAGLGGDFGVLWAEHQLGRATELVRRRGAYNRSIRSVYCARWRGIPRSCAVRG